jgi:hypothetical protein
LRIANMTVTPMYEIHWIFRIICFVISFWHCKKNLYRSKLHCGNHLSLQLRHKLRHETSLSRRLINATRVVAMEWSSNGYSVLVRQENPEKIPRCTGKKPRQFSLAVALSFVTIAHNDRKSDADKVISLEQLRPMENSLYMSFQAHQPTIYLPDLIFSTAVLTMQC